MCWTFQRKCWFDHCCCSSCKIFICHCSDFVFFAHLAKLWRSPPQHTTRGSFVLRQHNAPYLPISPPPPPPDTPVWPEAIHWFAPSRRLDPEDRSRGTRNQKHLGRDVLRVITHAWPLNGHVCYLHNNASRAAKSFIAPSALVVAPCQTHTHSHACFPLWSPQVILQQVNPKRMQGGTNSHGTPHNLHQTLKVGLSSAHLHMH